jgi:S-adenosyl methyltransferase
MARADPSGNRRAFADLDVSRPNVARVYDAFLGGKDNLVKWFRQSRTVTRQLTYRHVTRIIRKSCLPLSESCPVPVWVLMSVLSGGGS